MDVPDEKNEDQSVYGSSAESEIEESLRNLLVLKEDEPEKTNSVSSDSENDEFEVIESISKSLQTSKNYFLISDCNCKFSLFSW